MNAPYSDLDFYPASAEAEQALLGAILHNNDVILAVSEIVEPDHFNEALHSTIYSLMLDKIGRGEGVSPLTLITALGKDAKVELAENLTLAQYVARLAAEATSSGLMAPEYAKTIRDLWSRRRLLELGRDMMRRATGNVLEGDVESLLDQFDQDLQSVRYGKQIAGVAPLGDFADRALKGTAAAFQSDARPGYDTGINAIDEMIGPIMPGDLITLLAPSGAGKSALAAQILLNNCRPSLDASRVVPTLFVSQEMGGAQVARRVLATETGTSTRAQRAGDVNQAEYGRLLDAAGRIKAMPFYVDESGRQTTSRIIRKLRAMKKRHGIKIAAIDHLLLIRPEHPRDSKFDVIEHAAMEFKDAAKDLDMAILLLAQVTRESQKRETWKIRDQDLFGGDIVKQCSDIMLTLTLPEKWLRQREPEAYDTKARDKWNVDMDRWKGRAEVTAPKVRDGEDGASRIISFDGPRTLFSD